MPFVLLVARLALRQVSMSIVNAGNSIAKNLRSERHIQ